MDPLVEIPTDRWSEVRNVFKDQRPGGIPAYNSLDLHVNNPRLRADFGTKVYCPYGLVENGTVMLTYRDNMVYVKIFISGNSTEKLEQALLDTKVLDKNESICVPWADSPVIRLVKKIQHKLGWIETGIIPTIRHMKYKNTEPYPDLKCPPNTYTGAVQPKHVPRVAETWPHTDWFAEKYFQKLLQNDLSYGLFSKEDDSLVAWIFIGEVGYLTHLYCEESHRKKGYAEFVARWVTNDQLAKGNDLVGYMVEGNRGSMNIFRKLDYDVTGRGVWMFFKRGDKVNNCNGAST